MRTPRRTATGTFAPADATSGTTRPARTPGHTPDPGAVALAAFVAAESRMKAAVQASDRGEKLAAGKQRRRAFLRLVRAVGEDQAKRLAEGAKLAPIESAQLAKLPPAAQARVREVTNLGLALVAEQGITSKRCQLDVILAGRVIGYALARLDADADEGALKAATYAIDRARAWIREAETDDRAERARREEAERRAELYGGPDDEHDGAHGHEDASGTLFEGEDDAEGGSPV